MCHEHIIGELVDDEPVTTILDSSDTRHQA